MGANFPSGRLWVIAFIVVPVVVALIGAYATITAGQRGYQSGSATAVAVIQETQQAVPTQTPHVVEVTSPPMTVVVTSPPIVVTSAPVVVTATPEPATPTPECQAGCTLYQADWSKGMNGWVGTPDWKVVGGTLVNDGSGGKSIIMAPYKPKTITDYAVEAELQMVGVGSVGLEGVVGYWVLARTSYCAGVDFVSMSAQISVPNSGSPALVPLDSKPFNPEKEWHLYRVEVQGDMVRLFVDKALVTEVTNEYFLEGGEVGLLNIGTQFKVKSFRIIKL